MRSVNSLTTLNSMLQKLFHPQLVWDAFEKAEYLNHFQTTTMPSEFTWHCPSLTRKERDRLLCWPFSVLKRVMNQLRSTVGQDKLCALSLFEAHLTNNMDCECIVTGSIARSANCRYLIYSDADFEVFRPAGATRCTDGGGWNLAWRRSPPPCQISRPSVQRQGRRTPKT